MVNEKKVLAACLQDRRAWESINDNLDREVLSPEGAIIERLIGEYYEADKAAQKADPEILSDRAKRAVQSNKQGDLIAEGIATLNAMDVSVINVASEVLALRRSILSNKLAARLAAGKSGPEIKNLMDEYQNLDQAEPVTEGKRNEVCSNYSASSLVAKSFSKEGLIRLWPKTLNDRVDGGARKGHHILVFARPEMGKSAFAINLCFGFLKQNLKILYVGNEDPMADILMRMMSRLTGATKYEIMEKPQVADELLSKRNWSKFYFANFSPGTPTQIDEALVDTGADVVVVDQLRNVEVDSENRTQALEKISTQIRNICKRRSVLGVSVTQAGDSASGKRLLTLGDVDSSNTGVAAQVDLMIGIGGDDEMIQSNMRMISLCKNKLSGDHRPFPVQVNPALSMIVEEAA